MKIVFATNNANKLHEVSKIIPKGIKIVSLKDINCLVDIPETSKTLEGNSFLKANYVYQNYKKNALADDTGLEIDALNGSPGVFSARFAGEPANHKNNIQKVLLELQNQKDRNAQFRTIFTLILNGNIFQFEGTVKGKIIKEERGLGGFGYDPIFIPEGHNRTFAELPLEIKNEISHRGIATKKVIEFLDNI